jgi:hypothetical protein
MSPMESSLGHLRDGVLTYMRRVNDLNEVLSISTPEPSQGQGVPIPSRVGAEIGEVCKSIEEANDLLTPITTALRDELGDKKILG